MAKLSALQVKNAKPGRHADGNGLYLLVRPSGSRSWVLRAQVNGKRQDLGLGSSALLTLAEARSKAFDVRKRLKMGEPLHPATAEPARVPTFEEAARQCFDALQAGWSNKNHKANWIGSLDAHVFPLIGTKPVDEVNSLVVRDVLAPIWLKIPETARRILQRFGTVLDFAHIQGWRPEEASLRSVRKGLPRQPLADNHFEAMPYEDIPAFVAKLLSLPDGGSGCCTVHDPECLPIG